MPDKGGRKPARKPKQVGQQQRPDTGPEPRQRKGKPRHKK